MKFTPGKIITLLLLMLASICMYGQQGNSPTLKGILEKQLREGTSWNPASTTYDEQDLTVTLPIIKTYLIEEGFEFPNREEFATRIKQVFGRTIDYGSVNQYVRVDLLDQCNRSLSFSLDGEYVKDLFAIKKEAFITPLVALPALIDYQKEYPQLAKIEDKTVHGGDKEIEVWRNLNFPTLLEQRQFNVARIIAINMYLFQGSKRHKQWLLEYDKAFVNSLVITHGYTKDDDFNRFVLQGYLDHTQANHIVAQGSVGDIVVTRNCKGKLEIKTELLRMIVKMTSKEDSRLTSGLLQFIIKQGHGEKLTLSSNERRETYAYLSNEYDNLYIQNEKQGLGIDFYPNTLMAMLLAHDKGAEVYLKSKNYFGLSHLKEIVTYAKNETIYE
ncbi:hypothetical protein KO02_00300 [Sphingobacterium sp. ML3W]|uniref:hypothetical protein n=1 Tax=Sphingobacterium sp. ML3W TaxID=1538644 RepID=UPI0004F82ECB|nr:hypothetical protein [Sphingobacterium sp. ML3W]AIM35278.1 hypothetical protein KO02_00300 [Sphingobacterium sp. ML3W]